MAIKRALPILILVAGIVVAVAGVWALIAFVGLQASLVWTAILGAAAWLIRSNIEQRRAYQRLLADKKREQYFEFLDFLNHFAEGTEHATDAATNADQAAQPKAVERADFRKWSLRLTLIGSDDVVRAWNTARLATSVRADSDAGVETLRKWGRLWLAMRKDCGHPDTRLRVSEVLASFVNDIDRHRMVIDQQ